MNFKVLIRKDEDGKFAAEVAALPGCISQGSTRSEAKFNINKAISGYLESLKKHNERIPPPVYIINKSKQIND